VLILKNQARSNSTLQRNLPYIIKYITNFSVRGIGFYFQKTISVVISTLSNFLSVDSETWNHIKQQLRPVYNNRTENYIVRCREVRRLRIRFDVQTSTANKGLMIPGTDLIKQTKSGYCILKVRPTSNNQWVLGGPFLRHYCIQVELDKQTLTFVNNTIFNPWRKHFY
jgi:hypothetical protein